MIRSPAAWTGLLPLIAMAFSLPATSQVEVAKSTVILPPKASLEKVHQLQSQGDSSVDLIYLSGRLLAEIGQKEAASAAFLETLTDSGLGPFGRYHLAELQEADHPEVSAGIVAHLLSHRPPTSLIPPAVSLFRRTLAEGGDCRLLHGLQLNTLPKSQRRSLRIALADCALQRGEKDLASAILVSMLEESTSDESAREATGRLLRLQETGTENVSERLLGEALHHHQLYPKSVEILQRFLSRETEKPKDRERAYYVLARSYFRMEDFPRAAASFLGAASSTKNKNDRARSLYQRGRSLELSGLWNPARTTFLQVFRTSPQSNWGVNGLYSALRIDWRFLREEEALQLYTLLRNQRRYPRTITQASLFLASSDLVQNRGDRAEGWLRQAASGDRRFSLEVSYWRGRLAEIQGDFEQAQRHYLAILRTAESHPLVNGARKRLRGKELLAIRQRSVASLRSSENLSDQWTAWLLGFDFSEEDESREIFLNSLKEHPEEAGVVSLAPVPIEEWPLWEGELNSTERRLIGLGLLEEVRTKTLLRIFPTTQPRQSLSASQALSRRGAHREALYLAESLEKQIRNVPSDFHPSLFRRLLYPLPWRNELVKESREAGIDPLLLASIIRQESRFQEDVISAAAARGLTQFVLPTARRISAKIGLGSIAPQQLYQPEISISLGAHYLAELLETFKGRTEAAITAYNAGVPQTQLWRAYCFSEEPEEYLTKVGFKETRDYLIKVHSGYEQYQKIYPILGPE